MRKRLALLISNTGTGSNLQAIIDAIEKKDLNAEIVVVISDTRKAVGLEGAIKAGLKTKVVNINSDLTTLFKKTYAVDYIILAGWKMIIPSSLIDEFSGKILNLHPGLIPNTLNSSVKNPDGTKALWNRGKLTDKAIAEFIKERSSFAGSSVHFLTREFDFGQVLGRVFEKILPDDTIKSLYTRLKKKENKLYVRVLKKLCKT